MMLSSLIWTLACPLGMFAMGAVAWAATRLPGRRAERLARAANHATCMPMSARPQPTEVEQSTQDAGVEERVPAHV
jgi:hypothetical protein